MVSIILTNYVEDYARFVHLRYSFKQLLKTKGDYEIIVVDNSACEGYKQRNSSASREFFKQYAKRIIYLPQKKNLGMGAAKNVGVQRARGDYLMFVDNDFFYHTPDWLLNLQTYYQNGTILSPMAIRDYYHLKYAGAKIQVSKFSPGCFFIDRKTYGGYQWDEHHPVPGRALRVAFKDIPQYILKESVVSHEGYDLRSPHR